MVTLCVLLWPRDGSEADLIAYEDVVLGFLPTHGAAVVQRARTDGSDGQPPEVQLLEFPSEAALAGFLADGRRAARVDERDRAILRTDVLRVSLV
jgi:hypothetical protein